MKRLAIISAILLFIPGCVEKEIVDNLNIVAAVGFDKGKDDEFTGTFLMQDFLPDKSIENRTFTSKAPLRRRVLLDAQRQSPEPLVTGGMMVTIFEEELAKDGIIDFIDAYQRDASIGSRLYLATSEGKSKKILEAEFGSQGNGTYLYNLISHNLTDGEVPKTNLHILLHDYYQKGKDIYLPRIKLLGDKVTITGMTLFKNDKAVDVLPADKMFYFKLLVDKYSEGNFRVPLKKGEASVHSISSKHKFRINKKDPSQLTIHIEIKGVVKEYTGEKLTPPIVKEIEKSLQKKVEDESLKLIKQFQEKGIDPIGLGQFYKTQNRGFDFKKWEDDYKNLHVTVKCDATIEETGVID